jgi:tetratricopeptide (TPR) repeat protein
MQPVQPKSLRMGMRFRKMRRRCPHAIRALALCCGFVLATASSCRGQENPPEGGDKSALAEADRLLKQGEAQKAIELLLPLTDKQSSAPGVEGRLGKAYYETRDLPLALQHLSNAVKQDSEDWESTQLLAITSFGLGDCRQAASLLLKVIPHLTEGQADAARLLGLCYLRLQEFENARGAFATMFGVTPDGPMAYFLLGKMMVNQHMDDAAVPELQKALELDPHLAMARFILGEIDLTRSDAAKALSEFKKELEVNPSVWLVYWRLGDAYMRLQRYDEAEQALKQALWLNDSFTGGYLMLGEIELDKDEPNLARGFLERAVKLDPQNSYGHYFLGRAYQKLGKLDEANREFELQKAMRNSKYEGDSPSQTSKY